MGKHGVTSINPDDDGYVEGSADDSAPPRPWRPPGTEDPDLEEAVDIDSAGRGQGTDDE
jgi:hypothetical protein